MAHPASWAEQALLAQVREERTRASGPGGQHRNRVATAVRLTHLPTGIQGQASERRSQAENRRVALWRLRVQLALRYRTPLRDQDFVPPGAFQPSSLWLGRLHEQRLLVNAEHQDFPALLAEALDALNLYQDEVAAAAAALRVSPTQLVKLLAKEPAALVALNQRREQAGKKPLKG